MNTQGHSTAPVARSDGYRSLELICLNGRYQNPFDSCMEGCLDNPIPILIEFNSIKVTVSIYQHDPRHLSRGSKLIEL